MKFEPELITQTIVKPSSPTPDHLRHFSLSFLDQLCPPVYYPLTFFYQAHLDTKSSNINTPEKLFNQLERSLADVLTHFYPLAGRLKDNVFIDCNDSGIPYVQARVKCYLSHFLEESKPSELNKLLPFELDGAHESLLGVQFNIFDCGGIGIGVCISHKIADASSFFTFVKTWAAATTSGSELPEKLHPEFVSPALFPSTNISGYNTRSSITNQKTVGKRFVFTKASIEALIDKHFKVNTEFDENNPNPSPVEAVSLFVWSRIVASTNPEVEPAGTGTRFYQLVHVVNFRSRMNPPLPERTFGNMQWVAATLVPAGEQLHSAVRKVRESINKIDNEYMKVFQEGDVFSAFKEENDKISKNGAAAAAVRFTFAGFCEFGMYEVDFGWGRPVWVGLPSVITFNNQISFCDTASGEGIEVKVQLKEEDMAKFQEDKELLEFVINPTFVVNNIELCP
ncbi:hypothetical protein Tsubulata_047759 [Turnera subulata]|uniref:Uncharacterized protein n=1 Tax=Turnera subulata TaxID=218843 RepID=A0A9Q0G7L1_9ROSI|nr:hypothetical protein Tsubulata_047759 [Turnera subulata]